MPKGTIVIENAERLVTHSVELVPRPLAMLPLLERHFAGRERPIDILEIGVFRADLSKGFLSHPGLRIGRYDGVDPFLGDEGDPYLNSYWRNREESASVYEQARSVFDGFGQRLHRTTSQAFAESLSPDTRYDLIYIDGDHRYREALWDIATYFRHIADGGLLAIDDYANVDTPDVTPACNAFIQANKANIRKIDSVPIWFKNLRKEVPVVQVTVFIEPVPDAEKVDVGDVLEQLAVTRTAAPTEVQMRDRILDLSPRKVVRFVRKRLLRSAPRGGGQT